jgi:hypothetical protein
MSKVALHQNRTSLGHMPRNGSLHEVVVSKLAIQRCCCSPGGWRAPQLGLASHCRGSAQDKLKAFQHIGTCWCELPVSTHLLQMKPSRDAAYLRDFAGCAAASSPRSEMICCSICGTTGRFEYDVANRRFPEETQYVEMRTRLNRDTGHRLMSSAPSISPARCRPAGCWRRVLKMLPALVTHTSPDLPGQVPARRRTGHDCDTHRTAGDARCTLRAFI